MQECKINYAGSENTKQLKSVATGKTLSYSQGDILYYSVFSGKNNTIITDSPTMTKLYSVEFYECIDKDRQNYPIVKIGEQWWMAKNLAYLPSVSIHGMSGSTQYYVFDYIGTDIAAAKATVYYKTYGVLYTWQAAMGNSSSSNATPSGVKGVCPEGWHLPSNAEWTILANSLGGESVAGGKLRESGTAHWIGPNTDATNESGFSGLPGGSFYYMGGFFGLGNSVYWWSSTACPTSEYFIIDAWYRNSGGNNISFYPAHFLQINGFSIRCVKD